MNSLVLTVTLLLTLLGLVTSSVRGGSMKRKQKDYSSAEFYEEMHPRYLECQELAINGKWGALGKELVTFKPELSDYQTAVRKLCESGEGSEFIDDEYLLLLGNIEEMVNGWVKLIEEQDIYLKDDFKAPLSFLRDSKFDVSLEGYENEGEGQSTSSSKFQFRVPSALSSNARNLYGGASPQYYDKTNGRKKAYSTTSYDFKLIKPKTFVDFQDTKSAVSLRQIYQIYDDMVNAFTELRVKSERCEALAKSMNQLNDHFVALKRVTKAFQDPVDVMLFRFVVLNYSNMKKSIVAYCK